MAALCWQPQAAARGETQGSDRGTLVISITGIRSDKGFVALGISNNAKQWPDSPAFAYKWDKSDMKNGSLTVTIADLPYDTYAFAVLDDENSNLQMDYTLGLPREGWGMSMDPSFLKLTPPSFEECAFDLDAPVIRTTVQMNYLRKNKNVR